MVYHKKNISVFLASSEELKQDRIAFGDYIRRLSDIFEKRGLCIKLKKWEDFDAAYNGCRGSEGQELLYTNNEVINKLEKIDGK